MYSQKLQDKGAAYMFMRRPDTFGSIHRADVVFRDLCSRARRAGSGSTFSTAGFSVTFRDEGGMGVFELSEHVVDIYDVPEDDECPGFEWSALDSLNEV